MNTQSSLWKLEPGSSRPQRIPIDPQKETSLNEISQNLPEGAYTTLRIYPGQKVARLSDHINRLQTTARLAEHPVSLSEVDLRSALRIVLAEIPGDGLRLRITVDLQRIPGTVYISSEALQLPAAHSYQAGVAVQTFSLHRENPKAKLTRFISVADQAHQELAEGVNEGLMISPDGRILEGLTSNFFGVVEGVIWTAEEGVLDGLTRKLVLEETRKAQLPLRMEGLPVEQTGDLQEAWITSASRGVLPVVSIDDRQVGGGVPGPVTRLLQERYDRRIQAELEAV